MPAPKKVTPKTAAPASDLFEFEANGKTYALPPMRSLKLRALRSAALGGATSQAEYLFRKAELSCSGPDGSIDPLWQPALDALLDLDEDVGVDVLAAWSEHSTDGATLPQSSSSSS